MNQFIPMRELAQDAEWLDELCGGDERLFADMMLGESNIDRIVLRIHEQLARDEEMLAGIKERKAAIAERQKRIEQRRDAAKAMIGKALRIARLPKLELPEVTYSVRDGKAGLEVVDPAAVPEQFLVPKPVPDKRAINEAFEGVDELPNWLVRTPATDIVTGRSK